MISPSLPYESQDQCMTKAIYQNTVIMLSARPWKKALGNYTLIQWWSWPEICPPKFMCGSPDRPRPQDLSVSGSADSVFKEVTEVKWSHRGRPDPIGLCPYKKKRRGHRHTQGRSCEVTGRRRSAHARERRLGRTSPAHTWGSDIQPPRLWRSKLLLLKPLRLRCVVMGALEK